MMKERIDNKREIIETGKSSLDAVITVPAYREGYAVVDMLYSIATQKDLPKEFKYAVFVVINNNPDESEEVYQSNMRTYTLLQALRSEKKISVDVNSDFDNDNHFKEVNHKIQEIQKSKLEINIIDIFSEGHTSINSNVGLARQAVAETAIGYLKHEDKALYVTTDADTMLDPNFLSGAHQCFVDFPELDALGGNIIVNTNIVTEEARQAYEDNILHQQLSFYIHEFVMVQDGKTKGDDQHHLKKDRASYLCGSATIVTRRAMDSIDGYQSIASAEDMQLGIDIREKGYAVADARRAPDVRVYTSARASDRTDRGFGRSVESWIKVPFSKHLVMTFEAEEKRESLMDMLADIHEDEACEGDCIDSRILLATQKVGLGYSQYDSVLGAYKAGEITPTIFTNSILLGLTRQIFSQPEYVIEMHQYVQRIEERLIQSHWSRQWQEYRQAHACDGDLRKLARCLVSFIKSLVIQQ